MYSVAGLVGLTGDAQSQPLAVLLFFVHIFRLIQVLLNDFNDFSYVFSHWVLGSDTQLSEHWGSKYCSCASECPVAGWFCEQWDIIAQPAR